MPSTSCALCPYKDWNCYVQQFRRSCIYKKIHYLTFDLDLGHTKHHQVPSSSCFLCICKVWSCCDQRFSWRNFTGNVTDGRTGGQTDVRTDRRTTDRLWCEINTFSSEKAGIIKRNDCLLAAYLRPGWGRELFGLTAMWLSVFSFSLSRVSLWTLIVTFPGHTYLFVS